MTHTSDAWWRESTVYQVYLRSFADADGDGVGDLRGLIDRFDHLAGSVDALGVDAIWLTPIYPSGGLDGGYDVTDYCAIDPVYGSLEDFDDLVAEAHRRGVRVIVDWVPNHTSDRHPWFEQSRASRTDGRRDWYVWADGHDGGPPNNWLSAFDGVGSAWSRDERTEQWYLHSFSPGQPDLNWENPEVRAAMHDVLSFWLARGVDGFRIDVAQCLGKDPGLRDNPWPITKPTIESAGRRHDEDWDSVFDRLAGLRRLTDAHAGRVLVGEVYVLDQRRLAEYSAPGRLHLAHDFTLIRQSWSADGFRRVIETSEAALDPDSWPAWFLNNHDHQRVPTRFGADGAGQERARAAAVMLLTLRGTPFLYQGEELGLADTALREQDAVDLDGRDGVRTPIPWTSPDEAGPGAGFTAGPRDPWLPIPPEATHAGVAAQRADPASMFSLYRRLLALRRGSPALRAGTYRTLAAPEGVYAYERTLGQQRLSVAVNFGAAKIRLAPDAFAGRLLLSSDVSRPRSADPLVLATHEAVILEPIV